MTSLNVNTKAIVVYISLFIHIVSLIGSLLIFAIFSTKKLAKLSISIYYRCLALTNLLAIVHWVKLLLELQKNVNLSKFLYIYGYIFFCIFPISSWTLTVISVDRMLKIVYPSRFRILDKKTFQLGTIIFIWIYNILFYVGCLVIYPEKIGMTSTTSVGDIDCDGLDINCMCITDCTANLTLIVNSSSSTFGATTKDSSAFAGSRHFGYLGFILISFANSTIVPFFIMISAALVTVIFVARSRRRVMNVVSNNEAKSRRSKQIRDFKFAVTSISLSIVFLVFYAPEYIFNIVVLDSESLPSNDIQTTRFFFNAFISSDYALNLFIPVAVNNLVREEFLRIVTRSSAKIGNKISKKKQNC